MISAHDAEVIGLIGDGDIIHRDCLDDDVRREASGAFTEEREAAGGRIPDFEYWAILEEQSGYSPLSRYDVHTHEGELAYAFEQYQLRETATEIMPDLDDDEIEVEWIDGDEYEVKFRVNAGPSVWLICDRCHERIE